MTHPLDLVIPSPSAAGRGRALLLLPGGGQEPQAFLQHLPTLDPDDQWFVAAARPRVDSDMGPLWYRVLPTYSVEDLDTSVEAVADAASRLAALAGLEPGDVVVAGFSQGSVVAASLHLDARLHFTTQATGILGGYLPPREDHVDWSRAEGRLVLCAHGRDDVSIFARRGWELARALQQSNAKLRWRETAGRHRLAPYLLAELRLWLADLVEGVEPAETGSEPIPEPVPTIELPATPVMEADRPARTPAAGLLDGLDRCGTEDVGQIDSTWKSSLT